MMEDVTLQHEYAPVDYPATATLAEIEHIHIVRVLTLCGGNKSKAAVVLGIDRKTVLRKLQQYGAAPADPIDAPAIGGGAT